MGQIGVKVWVYRGDIVTEATPEELARRSALMSTPVASSEDGAADGAVAVAEAPAPESDTPAAVEATASESETPAETEAPAAESETPTTEAETLATEAETPAAEAEAPAVEDSAPAETAEAGTDENDE